MMALLDQQWRLAALFHSRADRAASRIALLVSDFSVVAYRTPNTWLAMLSPRDQEQIMEKRSIIRLSEVCYLQWNSDNVDKYS
jgi:hypothetical protein